MDREGPRAKLHTTNREDPQNFMDHGFYKKTKGRGGSISCPFKREMITRRECQKIGSNLDTNLNQCNRLQCPISLRLCWACLTFKIIAQVEEPGKTFCGFHAKNGAEAQPDLISISA